VLLIAAALAYYLLRPRGDIDSIAVLPFTNASNDPNLEYQADGLTEELINSLTQAPNLKVIARATVFRYKGRALDPQEIGKQLGVRSVLMGRIVRMDDRATVQADLVDARDGSQVWGRQFNRPVAELQAIHEEIAQQVIGKVQPGGADQKRLAKRRMVDPQAYDLYLQGRRALADVTAPRIRQSMVYFQQAIARDSNYAAAYAGLADSYSYLGIFELETPREVMPKAKEAALKALELDTETAEAYTPLGIVQSLYEWDWVGSEKRFRRAVELNPGGAYEQHWLGHYYETMGQWQQAQEQMRKALALDPLNPMYGEDLGYDLFLTHRYDEAVQQLRKVVELDPEDAVGRAFLALALEGKGLRSESLAENEVARQNYRNGVFVTGTIAGTFARLGRPEESRKLLAELTTLGK
jgi:TolB-like protein/Tfp pilus assembly protein PilF